MRNVFVQKAALFLTMALALILGYAPRAAAQTLKRRPARDFPVAQQNSASDEQPVEATTVPSSERKIVVPAGVRVPLMLRNGINTRTAKGGDSVYFETLYPIAQNDRIVIPVGSYIRGQHTEVKRPGRVKGRAGLQMRIDSLTYPNGYTVELNAIPDSADSETREAVDHQGKIKGRSGIGKDLTILAGATLGGYYMGTTVGTTLGTAHISSDSIKKGAVIGTAGGAATGLAAVLLTRGPEVDLPSGTTLDVMFDRPFTLDAGRLPVSDPELAVSVHQKGFPVERKEARRDGHRLLKPSLLDLIPF